MVECWTAFDLRGLFMLSKTLLDASLDTRPFFEQAADWLTDLPKDVSNPTLDFAYKLTIIGAYVAVTVVCGLKFEDYVSSNSSISLAWGWVALILSGALWIMLIRASGLFTAVLVGDVAVTLALAVFSVTLLNEPMSSTKWAGFGCALLSLILIQLPSGGAA